MNKRLSGRQLVRLSASTALPFGVNPPCGTDQALGKNHLSDRITRAKPSESLKDC